MTPIRSIDISDKFTGGNVSGSIVFSTQFTNKSYRYERNLFSQFIGFNSLNISYAKQIHSNRISRVIESGFTGDCDGLVTQDTNWILSIQVADCTPIFLYDCESYTIGLVHAGWRGTSDKIAMEAVKSMVQWYGSKPENIEVYLGPSIGVCCYEVGEEVANLFNPESIIRKGSGNYFLDLVLANRRQLISCGIDPAHIKVSHQCTCCDKYRFHSYRRDGKKSGRMICFFHLNNTIAQEC